MTVYKSQSGRTALKLKNEITAILGSCFRLDSNLWHYVGDTEPFDPSIKSEELERMFIEMVEVLDKQDFDLSKSISEISEEEFE